MALLVDGKKGGVVCGRGGGVGVLHLINERDFSIITEQEAKPWTSSIIRLCVHSFTRGPAFNGKCGRPVLWLIFQSTSHLRHDSLTTFLSDIRFDRICWLTVAQRCLQTWHYCWILCEGKKTTNPQKSLVTAGYTAVDGGGLFRRSSILRLHSAPPGPFPADPTRSFPQATDIQCMLICILSSMIYCDMDYICAV